jgi:hypothetical protein
VKNILPQKLYLNQILKAVSRIAPRPGELMHINVYHDSICGIFRGRQCTCEPEIQFKREAICAKDDPPAWTEEQRRGSASNNGWE